MQLNFPLSEYSDDEVAALQGCTQEEMIRKLRQKAEQTRPVCGSGSVERHMPSVEKGS